MECDEPLLLRISKRAFCHIDETLRYAVFFAGWKKAAADAPVRI